jgi:hypothetical protein
MQLLNAAAAKNKRAVKAWSFIIQNESKGGENRLLPELADRRVKELRRKLEIAEAEGFVFLFLSWQSGGGPAA